MRKVAMLAAVAVTGAFAVAGVAQAVDAEHKLVVRTTPTKATTVHFDKNLVFNGSKLKSCAKSTVQSDQTKCPSESKVGTGKATGVALGQTENLTVTAFNGPGGNKLELHVVGNAPLVIDSVIEGVLKSDTGKFGKKLVVKIPENLQQPLTGVFATLTDFQVTLKGKGSTKKPYYIGLKGCSGGKINMKVDLTYTDGTSQSATSTTPCS